MPTQGYANRQAPTEFTLNHSGGALDVLATAPGTPVYTEGMSVNGGGALALEVDARNALDNIDLVALRRSDENAPWSSFWTGTANAGTVFSDRISGLAGYADVRLTALPEALDGQVVRVSAKISQLS